MPLIDLQSIKYIFVDFDDTLVVHNHNIHEYTKEKFRKDTISGKDAYPTSTPNAAITLLLRQAKSLYGIPSYGLSWVDNSLETKAKNEYCNKHMPGLISDVIGTASGDEKIEFMLAFAEVKNVEPENIIFIDDRTDTILLAKDAGFIVYTPQYIMEKYIEQLSNKFIGKNF